MKNLKVNSKMVNVTEEEHIFIVFFYKNLQVWVINIRASLNLEKNVVEEYYNMLQVASFILFKLKIRRNME
jgi:hypothetical protein